jgi:hypothetical protein
MPGLLVHVGALVTCPHPPGTITAIVSSPRVFVNGTQAVLGALDIPTVSGCTFQVPVPGGTKPQPCVTVKLETAKRVLVNGQPAAILTPAAVCLPVEKTPPQGTPNSTPIQKRVIAT